MNNKILLDLYWGRVSATERKIKFTDKENEVYKKIEEERQYFSFSMSPEDYERFEAFENLLDEVQGMTDISTFIYAFKLGAMLMCDVFMGEVTEK